MKKFNLSIKNLFIISLLLNFVTFCLGCYALFFLVFYASNTYIIAKIFKSTIKKDEEEIQKNQASTNRFVIYLTIVNFFILLIASVNIKNVTRYGLFGAIMFILASVAILIALFYGCIKYKILKYNLSLAKFLELLPLIIISILVLVLSLDCFHTYAKFDTLEYLRALNLINIHTFNDISYLKLYNHISIVYSICVYALSCLIGNMYYAAILFNILCNIIIVFVTYKLVKTLCPKVNKIFAYLCAALFVFSPFLFGLSGYIYIDTAMMYFTIIFIYSLATKEEDKIFLSANFLMFSKEIGVALTALLVFFPIFIEFCKAIKEKRFKLQFKNQMTVFNVCYILLHVLFMVCMLISNWIRQGGYVEYFVFKPVYIANIFADVFLTNFNWILTIVVVLALIKFLIELITKKTNFKTAFQSNVCLKYLVATMLINLFINCFIVTWSHTRYVLTEIVSLYFIAFFSLSYLFEKRFKKFNLKMVSCVFLVCLLPIIFVQNYLTIDFVMKAGDTKIYMGSKDNYICAPGYYFDTGLTINFLDFVVYNKQVNTFDRALDLILKRTGCDDDTIYLNSGESYRAEGYNANIFGNYGWDSSAQKRFFTENKSKMIKFVQFEQDDDLGEIVNNVSNRYYYIDFNNGSASKYNADIKKLVADKDDINISDEFNVDYYGWRFTIYKLTLN